ncbi:hypothetical protein CONCODRAFT_1917 [Conidiobolus coronatus NRRL 28638]|uniref:Galactose oxidase n=1 Tax=Conidiobolus coronatus (strain ATCC 28846 / CBS 209.66 / NRRL 28638) TaxID=796925 RepID=A0A137PIN3_CONC2|nr:hypothetical protein CONCODRAFT_1917 [Conidiobolus coronatus NRRL 28638]|eukprot:KXN74852.1 hypothetical protein CONCODRAFT_1917 [Conidiobolus coronatus NRRL 28638]
MSLINDSNLIQFPTHENFPVKGYTINTIKNGLGAALYVTGGDLYSKKDRKYSECNSFYKYNFTSKGWVDMSHSVDGKLKPLSYHNSVVIDNRYLVILGGRRRVIYSGFDEYKNPIYEYNSLYNLTIFDTVTSNWENVNINVGIFDTNIVSFQFNGFLATAYKDKIVVLGGSTGVNQSNINIKNGHLGILDLKSKSWAWTPILNEDGSIYGSLRVDGEVLAFNDQLIISSSVFNGIRE